jgi:hypothetical protein
MMVVVTGTSQTESEWDLDTLEEGTWGGGVIDGPSSDLTTFRGEAFGLLATLQYVKVGRWAGIGLGGFSTGWTMRLLLRSSTRIRG